jgi:hypothetical protein
VRALGWVIVVVLAWAGGILPIAVRASLADTLCLDAAHNIVPCPAPTTPSSQSVVPSTTVAPPQTTTAQTTTAELAPTTTATAPTLPVTPIPTTFPTSPSSTLTTVAGGPTHHKKGAPLGGWPTALIVCLVAVVAAPLLLFRRERARAGRYQARRGRTSQRS